MTLDEAKRRKSLARWHRRLALLVGLWLAVLALSGILINHAHDWGLDRAPLPSALQSGVYGIESEHADYCERATELGPDCHEVFTALALPAGELLLGATRLFLLDGPGQVIESLAAANFGLTGVRAGVRHGDAVYLRDERRIVRTDADLLDWEVLDDGAAAALGAAPWQVRGADAITWERLFLDLHAARFLGPAARWANDLLAGLILVLVISGAWLYRAKRGRG